VGYVKKCIRLWIQYENVQVEDFMRYCLVILFLITGVFLEGITSAMSAAPVSITENEHEVILQNGIVRLIMARRGGYLSSVASIQDGHPMELGNGNHAMYFDANGGPATPPIHPTTKENRAGYIQPISSSMARIVQNNPDKGEISFTGQPSEWFPFETELHYILFRGQSGFYFYVTYKHGAGMPGASIGQTRVVIKGVPGPRLFTNHMVDEKRKGPFPTSPIVSQVQDATYLLQDGTIYTKYDNTIYEGEHHVHGMAGHGVGIWMIFPSNEFIGGGPLKQELSVHMDNVLLAMLLGGHFGSGDLRFLDNEPWDRVYGPLFVYVNHSSSPDVMFEDARNRAQHEMTKWPYQWLHRADYPLLRGSVRGKIALTSGASVGGAWAILAAPGENWSMTTKGYEFWSKVRYDGSFAIPKVRPGVYTLYVSGGNQFEDYQRQNVDVKSGEETNLGNLKWQPIKHGVTLWQIGVADRSSGEFRDGHNYRHYGNFLRYPKEFPDDVIYNIGKSKANEDWNFAQWSWYCKRPYWEIRFPLREPLSGKATLTIGFAAVDPPHGHLTDLQVKVNGTEISVVRIPKSGAAAYRSGRQDSQYNVVYLPFDASLLRKGINEITLGHLGAVPFSAPEDVRRKFFGAVMYDSIRLEVDSHQEKQ
jgi:rhamnogalacturonan endolyase